MSNWTHVSGVIRVDALVFDTQSQKEYHKAIAQKLGKICTFKTLMNDWELVKNHPEEYMPMGSEGSLEYVIIDNPDLGHLSQFTIPIWGDLRDHDDPDEIIDWFRKICDSLCVRNAVITVQNELNGTKTFTYGEEE